MREVGTGGAAHHGQIRYMTFDKDQHNLMCVCVSCMPSLFITVLFAPYMRVYMIQRDINVHVIIVGRVRVRHARGVACLLAR